MIVKFNKVWYDNITQEELNLPDGCKFYRIDYSHYYSFKGHECYGLLIESPSEIEENENNELECFSVEERYFGIIYQCYVDNISIFSDLEELAPFHNTYLETRNNSEFSEKLNDALNFINKEDGTVEITHEVLKEIQKYENGRLCSLTKLSSFTEEGIVSLEIYFSNFFGNDKKDKIYENISQDIVKWDEFLKFIDPYEIGGLKRKLLGDEATKTFNDKFNSLIADFRNTYNISNQ